MKKLHSISALFASFFLVSFTSKPVLKAPSAFDGRGYNTSLMMDFTDSSAEEIQAYYGDISNRVGDELKDYLYTRIATHRIKNESDTENLKYYQTYSTGVTKWYKITDRNWSLSREITPETYKFKDDTYDESGSNYYETMLYYEDNTTVTKQITTDINSFSGVVGATNIDWANKTCPKATGGIYGNNKVQVDKEHVWVKSHGFSPSGDPAKGAGTDLHHLIAADHNTNNVHNDKYYGVVADKTASTTSEVYCLYADGTYDRSGWTGLTDEGEECFEPTDQYKGNIARALFYMATRYSKELSPNSENEPYLTITKGNTGSDDNTSFKGVFHNLEDFLVWNELDPVDEYEIHRNNLIFKNVQDNRNPFIDHPEWVRRVFDENYNPSQEGSETPTTSSSAPSQDNTSSSVGQAPFSLFGLDTQTSYIVLIAAAAVGLIIIILIMLGAVKLSKKTKKKVRKAVVKAVKTNSKKSSNKKK